MPMDIHAGRQAQGNYQRRYNGHDGASHGARCHQRFGAPMPGLNPRGMSNTVACALLLANVLPRRGDPRAVAHPSPGLAPARTPTSAMFPGAWCQEDMIEMQVPPTQHSTEPLLVPAQVGNTVDLAAGICISSPGSSNCRRAIAAAGVTVAVTTLVGAGTAAWQLLSARPMPQQAPAAADVPSTGYVINDAALLPAARFDASDCDPLHDPCESLGAHVNGRWEQTAQLTPGRTREGTFDRLRDRSLLVRQQLANQIAGRRDLRGAEKVIADLWTTGMDQGRIERAGLAPLSPELQRIERLQDAADLRAHLYNLAALGRNPLFMLSTLPDLEDPGRYMTYAAQGGLGLPDSAWYADPDRQPALEAYRGYAARLLELSGMAPPEAAVAAAAAVELERSIADASLGFADLNADIAHYFNPVDLATADALSPGIGWDGVFAAHGTAFPKRFSLGMPGFFKQLGQLLDTAALASWQAYLRFHALDRAAPLLGADFVAAHHGFHDQVLKGRDAPVPRWGRVLDIIEHVAGDAFGRIYGEAAFSPASAQLMHDLGEEMVLALKERIASTPWMEASTREEAIAKVGRMRLEYGVPARWQPWSDRITEGAIFVHDVQAVEAFAYRRNVMRTGPVDPSEWKMTPQTVDAYYDPVQNRLILPAALLQPPFFDPDGDMALNFGGIGAIIGHEMAHAFDSLGRQFDANGTLRDWWTETDQQRFEPLAQRLIDQFERYQVNGQSVNGVLTLDENLADLAGVAIALDAMQQACKGRPDPMVDGMTREQRFFANFAFTWRTLATAKRVALDMATENHAPASVRADAAPSHLEVFARAFNCTPGAPMARLPGDRIRFI